MTISQFSLSLLPFFPFGIGFSLFLLPSFSTLRRVSYLLIRPNLAPESNQHKQYYFKDSYVDVSIFPCK